MTHRDFSRNASSSRAIPVRRMLQDIVEDTAMPLHWGMNEKGMQAGKETNAGVLYPYDDDNPTQMPGERTREEAWFAARDNAIQAASAFDCAGYHKQVVNRLLEPFMHINVLVSSTKWANFFTLRDHEAAEPHIRILAQAMKKAMSENTPKFVDFNEWHLPFVEDENIPILGPELSKKISVARSARVSYLTQDGRVPTVEEDVALYDRLVGAAPLHASPAEHQGTPDMYYEQGFDHNGKWAQRYAHGNFYGWVQLRKTLRGEYVREE